MERIITLPPRRTVERILAALRASTLERAADDTTPFAVRCREHTIDEHDVGRLFDVLEVAAQAPDDVTATSALATLRERLHAKAEDTREEAAYVSRHGRGRGPEGLIHDAPEEVVRDLHQVALGLDQAAAMALGELVAPAVGGGR
ncbi:MAG: hypothetical protein JNK72_24925 [Myxococcales bacterium]|nr:hypothetical protein [Myxococcales bacterium]